MEDMIVSFPGLGLEFTINRVAFTIFNIPVYWYGLIIVSGMALALIYASRSSKRYNVNMSKLFYCVFTGLITGIVGARLYYCAFRWEYYGNHLNELFYIHNGGLAIYGGIIGALLGGLIVAKVQKMKLMPVLDISMMGFLLGQGIGRWGNFTNQEAFGTVTDLPWGMVSVNTGNVPVHPCFLYESLWCLLGFAVLHFYGKYRQRYAGQIFYMYLVWYGFERMLVEGLRTDSLYLPFKVFGADVRVSQALSAVIMVVGIVFLLINIKKEDPFYADYRRKKNSGKGKRYRKG